MTRKYLAFDIEISKPLSGISDWKSQRPLGISCAATLRSDQEEPTLWYSSPIHGTHEPTMSAIDTQYLVDYLIAMNDEGYTILTFNGLGFDFDILAEESGRLEDCQRLASLHLDMFFHIFCLQGYCAGLGAIAKGLGLAGKTEGMHGALAPEMWQRGEYDKVLEYVGQDVRTTLEIAQWVDAWGHISWTSKSGKQQTCEVGKWLTVQEALELPEPDNSWMNDPWSREKFTGWLQS